MATKKGEPAAMPASFDPNTQYMVVVKKQFTVAGKDVRPGVAVVTGDIATENRANLEAAWVAEE